MTYVFVSHAAIDKRKRVRPLVEALIREGIKVWIDRPGHGENHFGFDHDYIEQNGIRYIPGGADWGAAIIRAINQSSAVLSCMSRAFTASRQVLVQEALLALAQKKLVACIVDDLPYDQIPADLGLVSGQRIHAERVDSNLLRQALVALEAETFASPDGLPNLLRSQWEIVRKIKRDLIALFPALPEPTDEEWAAAREALAQYPVFPMVKSDEIPARLIDLMVERFAEPHKATQFVNQTMKLRREVNFESGTDRQILVTEGERLPVHSVSPEEYWVSLITRAGHKGPRTLAALFLAPHAPRPDQLSEELRSIREDFLQWVKGPRGNSRTR